jgi:valyl-tRNA synthetase
MTFEERYNHRMREAFWQQKWEQNGVYAFKNDRSREQTYVIDTPPPTVSGQLHMGHIYSYTHADFMARYKRMRGFDVFYPMGFDDNGLPTERLVEKQKKIRAKDLSREDFIRECEAVSREARLEFRSLFTATALSVDWSLEYHTISEEVRRISQASFIDLYEGGHVERKLQPMFWDVVDQTAIAQAEIEDKELEGVFVDIRFQVEGGGEFVIGTTRPEMLPACVGIFYHPEDERYKHLAGKFAITPLFGVRVPILADDTVEIDKGTGIMMCCTFGDEADIVKWRKHNLETEIILNQYGKLTYPKIPIVIEERIDGLTVKQKSQIWNIIENKKVQDARTIIIKLLEDAGLIENKRNIVHAVKCAERSGAPLEILPSQQWFVKVLEHKQALKEKSKQCNWKPEWMEKRMEQWIDGLNWDWCISRQRYYGVPFPVWYFSKQDENGGFGKPTNIFVPKINDLPVNPLSHKIPKGFGHWIPTQHIKTWNDFGEDTINDYEFVVAEEDFPQYEIKKGDKVAFCADKDVMDTWATSSLTPQISAGSVVTPAQAGVQNDERLDSSLRWNDAERFNKLFPADLRPQAHEIIRTWAFYTLVKAHLHNDDIPWKNLMISGWCLASDKTKMSKSKGNVITPLSLLQEKSADAVRYWASTAKLGTDTAFSEDLLKIGAKLVNKLWNAAKFAGAQLEAMQGKSASAAHAIESGIITYHIDKCMLLQVHGAILEYVKAFDDYDYAGARQSVEAIFWNDFCDNYLEIVKARAYGNFGEEAQQSAMHTIYHTLKAILQLFAPFVPHITEDIYSKLYDAEGSIHARGNFPNANDYAVANSVNQNWEIVKGVVELVRKAKSERGVSIKYPIEAASLSGVTSELFVAIAADIKAVGNIAELFLEQELNDSANLSDESLKIGLQVVFAEKAEVA